MYTSEQRLIRLRVSLLRDKRLTYMSGTFGFGVSEIVDNMDGVDSAATDGHNKYYDRKFFDALPDAQARGLILHEEFHVLCMQMISWKHLMAQDQEKANCAFDYVVNLMVEDLRRGSPDFIQLPPHPLLDEKYRGMDSYQIFKLLPEGGGGGKPMDKHTPSQLPEEDLKQVKKQMEDALSQGALAAKALGHDVPRSLEEMLTPTVPWEDQLREFMQDNTAGDEILTWRKPSRRWLASGIYMQGHQGVGIRKMVAGVDTSGSINGRQMTAFLTEMMQAARAGRVQCIHLIYWDDEVRGHEVYEG